MQDIYRTHPGKEFFQKEWVRSAMLNCLFLFAKENGETAYRQGMHELLAVIMYLLNDEKMSAEQLKRTSLSGNTVAWEVLDVKFLESDAFAIFQQLMLRMNPLFEVVDTRVLVQPDGAFIADKKQAEEHAIAQSAIVNKCRRIQYTLLKQHDLPLHNYLKTLGIEPQLYALRWIRLLFGREFHFADVITLWDAIFAYGNNLALVDYLSVTMLMYIREGIVGKEYTDAMSRLMKFPPVENVGVFVESALRLARGGTAGPDVSGPAKAMALALDKGRTLVFNTSGKKIEQVQDRKSTSPPVSFVSSSSSASGAPSAVVFAAAERLEEVRESNAILAKRLNSLIGVLQGQVLSEEAKLPDMDSILLALAELKQMKDILSGSLDPTDAHLLFGEKGNPSVAPHPLDLSEVPSEGEEEQQQPFVEDVSTVESRNEEISSEVASFFALPSTSTTQPLPQLRKSGGPVAWADDDEELGKKPDSSSSSTSWLGGLFSGK